MLILIIPVSDVHQKHFRNMSAVNWSLLVSISARIVPNSQGKNRVCVVYWSRDHKCTVFAYLQVPLSTTEEMDSSVFGKFLSSDSDKNTISFSTECKALIVAGILT